MLLVNMMMTKVVVELEKFNNIVGEALPTGGDFYAEQLLEQQLMLQKWSDLKLKSLYKQMLTSVVARTYAATVRTHVGTLPF